MHELNQDSPTLRNILNAALPTLMALDKKDLRTPFLNRVRVADLTAELVDSAEIVKDRIVALFSVDHGAHIAAALDRLPSCSKAYYLAEIDAEAHWVPEVLARKQQLSEILTERDQTLVAWIKPAIRKNAEAKARLAEITPGIGVRDEAEDVLRLVQLYRDQKISSPEITDAFLDESETLATEQLTLLSHQDVDQSGSPADIRRRAFTEWFNNYNLVADAARYAAKIHPALDIQFSGAYAERNKPSTTASSLEQNQ